MKIIKNTPEEFWTRIERSGPEACWIWKSTLNKKGYGIICFQGRCWGAHRLAWMFTHGPIPDGLHVCHKCDNPPCCNPSHMFLGTLKENNQDMFRKGRNAHVTNPEYLKYAKAHLRAVGERQWKKPRHPHAKLTFEQVKEIEASTEPIQVVAERFGVHNSTVSRIRNHLRWGRRLDCDNRCAE